MKTKSKRKSTNDADNRSGLIINDVIHEIHNESVDSRVMKENNELKK